jgi:hypothetical protein
MRRSALRRLRGDDSGLGMVLVIAMGGVLSTLMIVITTVALHSLGSSRKHVSFESALATADGGIDTVLARAQQRYAAASADTYVTPAPGDPSCDRAAIAWPFATQPTAAQERTWARSQLEAMASDPTCRTSTSRGDVVLLKPTGRQVTYALAYAPAYGAVEVKRRLLKAEYLFTPFAPDHAVLTNGNLVLDASTTLTAAPPNAPALATAHSNSSVIVNGGNPTVYGAVTQSGNNPTSSSNNFLGNTDKKVAGAPTQSIPFPGALAVWTKNRLTNPPGGWYDLCPDGTARVPDAAAPCAGSALMNVAAGGTFRGWRFVPGSVPTWEATSALKVNGFSGTYYVSGGNAVDDGSNAGSPVPNLTVLASASKTSCNKIGGNIHWGSTDPAAPSTPSTWLIADQDLRTTSNYAAGSAVGSTIISGFFIAGDQIEMSTSSNGAYGAVLAADQCDPADGSSMVDVNTVKNPKIFYDPNAQAPFTDVINNTLWLEYGV